MSKFLELEVGGPDAGTVRHGLKNKIENISSLKQFYFNLPEKTISIETITIYFISIFIMPQLI